MKLETNHVQRVPRTADGVLYHGKSQLVYQEGPEVCTDIHNEMTMARGIPQSTANPNPNRSWKGGGLGAVTRMASGLRWKWDEGRGRDWAGMHGAPRYKMDRTGHAGVGDWISNCTILDLIGDPNFCSAAAIVDASTPRSRAIWIAASTWLALTGENQPGSTTF